MSVALVEWPSGLVGYLDNQERYQTTKGDVAMLANTIADERGIEGPARLTIMSGLAIEVPQELARATVPYPVAVLSDIVLAQDFRSYPFTADERPTWDEFLNIVRGTIRNSINAELRDAQGNFGQLANTVEAQRDLILQANAHMAHHIQLVNQRALAYFQAQQSHLENREAQISSALAAVRTPLMSVPRCDRALQEAICNKQFKLRAAPQTKAPGKKGTSGKTSGKVLTTAEQAKQSKTAVGRNQSGTVTQLGQPDLDWTLASESRANSPNRGEERQQRLMNPANAQSPFAARWMERVLNQQLSESETDSLDSRRYEGEERVSPEEQRTAADELTETFDVEDSPNTAIANPTTSGGQGSAGSGQTTTGGGQGSAGAGQTTPSGGQGSTVGGRQSAGNERQRTGPDLCTNCHKSGHSAIACPRCSRCDTYGHNAATSTWCQQCQSEHCKDICRDCRSPHTHTMMCPFIQRVLREFLDNPNSSYEHRSARFQRGIQHLRDVQEEMDAEAEQQAKDRGDKHSKRKGRADKQNPGGESTRSQNQGGGENNGTGTGGGTIEGGNDPPPDPPGGNSGNRRNHSRSPRRTHFGGSPPPGGGPPPGGDSSSSDSFNDSSDSGSEGGDELDMNEIQRLRKRLKSLEKKKRRLHKPDRLDIKPFSGDADDLHRFVLNVESKFDYHRKALSKDMDKIRLIVPLLEGKVKK